MDRKLKNTLILLVIFLVLIALASVYLFIIQKGKIEDRQKRIQELSLNSYNTEELLEQLKALKKRVAQLDSILAIRKYNIPIQTPQSKFYDFINDISYYFQPESYVNIEYVEAIEGKEYHSYTYKVTGTTYFDEFYYLVYAIEQSKELKKISSCTIDNFVFVEQSGIPHYQVGFNLTVKVFFSSSDRFVSSNFRENQLRPNTIYDIFYPLIRNEIPPNTDGLLDVQTAQLLALIPDGAFLSDAKGNTYLLWEGDKVYLGYLTAIDFEKNQVDFILNKGGLIEKINLTLQKEINKSK
ncbi:MAG: hypothetical protein CO129_06965 [Ignavibacteriales bacterium CG_4_9_14_3_um_filter_34_10]|nr:MAG: hypothetical protein CO129_06965 [Ignavibacteriales bacterium CG_4_9_14_3_um_filter_34_10]